LIFVQGEIHGFSFSFLNALEGGGKEKRMVTNNIEMHYNYAVCRGYNDMYQKLLNNGRGKGKGE
jgi:hypothetical protein